MKNLVLLSLLFLQCCKVKESFLKIDSVKTDFIVTRVQRAKYSKVEGFVYYKNRKYFIDNKLQGHYHKEYNLNPYDTVKINLDIYMSTEDSSLSLGADFNRFVK